MKAKDTPILVSACLLGRPCRYDGESRPVAGITRLGEIAGVRVIPICPECDGGLPTPRIPAERVGERVVSRAGTDVTVEYRLGAEKALKTARENGCRFALLKERSPSCGSTHIYDGTFTGKLISGRGVCCETLENAGIRVFSEEKIDELIAAIQK